MNESELTEKIKEVLRDNLNVDSKTSRINILLFCKEHGEPVERVTRMIDKIPGIKVYRTADMDIARPITIGIESELDISPENDPEEGELEKII